MDYAISTKGLFEYNAANKRRFAGILIGVGIILLVFLIVYFFFLKYSEYFLIRALNAMIEHVKFHISTGTIRGVLYTSIFGGLFFITIPLEAVFVGFLRSLNPFLLVLLFLGGFIVSFTLNYYMGVRLGNIAKKIITPKKFYKFKGLLNRYGPLTILVFNFIPFFPAQPLSAILGVFRYNKTKFYVYFLLGALLKFSLIAVGYIYIFAPA